MRYELDYKASGEVTVVHDNGALVANIVTVIRPNEQRQYKVEILGLSMPLQVKYFLNLEAAKYYVLAMFIEDQEKEHRINNYGSIIALPELLRDPA